MKQWEIIADNLHDAGFSLGWVATVDREGRTIWIVDAHRDDGRRFIVRADEILSAFVELERRLLPCWCACHRATGRSNKRDPALAVEKD